MKNNSFPNDFCRNNCCYNLSKILGVVMRFVTFSIIVIFLFSFNSCKENSVSPPVYDDEVEIVKTQVDLQSGFAGKSVIIQFDNETVYQSNLSNLVSLAGPEAVFTTYLPRGVNKIIVFAQNPQSLNEYFVDSTFINIGNKGHYYLGLQINESLKCIIQDSSFLYM